MVLKTHFNTYRHQGEQSLLENLVIEAIQQMGQEFLYLPRRRQNFDQLNYDDDQSFFDTSYPIEMYISSIDGFSGDRVFMSKFDVEIRDQIVFSVARRRWELEIGSKENFVAPREGDLIYFPLNKKMFTIMFTDNKPFFYQLGHLNMFNLTCEVYEYSSERLITGIAEIDSFQPKHSQNIIDFGFATHDGSYLVSHDGSIISSTGYNEMLNISLDDNNIIQKELTDDEIIDFTEVNPYSTKGNY